MGFEYKVRTTLTDKQITAIQSLFEHSKLFDKKYVFESKEFWDFRRVGNKGKMPNITINFETDGIFICQWLDSYLWTDLDELKNYMENEQIAYEILDYSE